MNRSEMIVQLQNGVHPIEVSLKKWIDISIISSINKPRTRHQLDEGIENCALCYTYKTCDKCLLYLCYHVACDESIGIENKETKRYEKKFKRDFYAQYRETGDAQIIISALIKLKKKLRWILLVIHIKTFFLNLFKKIILKVKKNERSNIKSSVF